MSCRKRPSRPAFPPTIISLIIEHYDSNFGIVEKRDRGSISAFDEDVYVSMDIPPAYCDAAALSDGPVPVLAQTATRPFTSVIPFRISGPPQSDSAQRVNNISLFSKHDPIKGTYIIDPLLPTVPMSTGLFSGEHNVRKIGQEAARDTRTPGTSFDGGSDNVSDVNAAFRTRRSPITLDLAVVGDKPQGSDKSRARIMASARHGNIAVNLFQIQQSRCVDLNLPFRQGNMIVLLPPDFDGPITIRQRRGRSAISFLPAFAERARVLRDFRHPLLCFRHSFDPKSRTRLVRFGHSIRENHDRLEWVR